MDLTEDAGVAVLMIRAPHGAESLLDELVGAFAPARDAA
jgi:hypothetical protein